MLRSRRQVRTLFMFEKKHCRSIGSAVEQSSTIVIPIQQCLRIRLIPVVFLCSVVSVLMPRGHDLICLNPVWLAGAPTLWFVALPEHDQPRPAISLVGFATEHFPVGTVITDPEFFTLPLRSEEQVGAIRWWYEDGIVDQVFIAEAWRRRHLGTAFTYAASAWQALHGKCSNLRSDGRRTELGKHLDAGTQFPNRFALITEISPPMDLPENE